MIYLDSAAVVKLVRAEAQTPSLLDWLDDHPDVPLVSSALVEVEVNRALWRAAPESLARVPGVLAKLYRLEIDAGVRAIAAAYDDPQLHSLDAIHLAAAAMLSDRAGPDLQAFVTYDKRLLIAAAAAGLPTACPGTE